MGRRKKIRFPAYTSIVGESTVISGALSFSGGLHVDGKIVGDVTAEARESSQRSALTLAASGVIEGNLDVPYAVIDGTVIGDVRASQRVVLAAGARIIGAVYYGALELDEGAEINGKLIPFVQDEGEGMLEPSAVSHVSVVEAVAPSADAPGAEIDQTRDSNVEA